MVDRFITIDTKKVQVKLDKLEEGISHAGKLMSEIGTFLVTSILLRTERGIDAEGAPFEGYSKSYKKLRASRDLPVDHVDLFFTGQMTSSLTYDATKELVQVYFMDTPRRGGKATNASVAFYNNQLREFFAISAKEQEAILELADTYFKRILER